MSQKREQVYKNRDTIKYIQTTCIYVCIHTIATQISVHIISAKVVEEFLIKI